MSESVKEIRVSDKSYGNVSLATSYSDKICIKLASKNTLIVAEPMKGESLLEVYITEVRL
jgi:hypothetical protein